MTQAERLVRNLCEERRLEIVEEGREALKQIPDTRPWRDLELRVQAHIREYRRLEARQAVILQDLKRRGYTAYGHNLLPKRALGLADRDARHAAAREATTRRRDKIQQLRTNATIASLGKSATEAQAILRGLQKDLRKV